MTQDRLRSYRVEHLKPDTVADRSAAFPGQTALMLHVCGAALRTDAHELHSGSELCYLSRAQATNAHKAAGVTWQADMGKCAPRSGALVHAATKERSATAIHPTSGPVLSCSTCLAMAPSTVEVGTAQALSE